MNAQLTIVKFVCAVLLQLTAFAAAYKYGHDMGYSASEANHQKADIATLNRVIETTEALTRDANAASLALNKSISDQKRADQKSTEVFAHALAVTANTRVNCVFDNNIMQQLDEAANRADQAAASGINRAVPTSGSPAD